MWRCADIWQKIENCEESNCTTSIFILVNILKLHGCKKVVVSSAGGIKS